MRLIDADALADALFDKRKNYPQWVADTIGNMPDAVVLCKNCIHKHEQKGTCHNVKSICFGQYIHNKWFCADGERAET